MGELEVIQEDQQIGSPVKDTKAKRVAVVEIFGPTIQGEGAMIGVKTMFVRFGGCDYRCTRCDSLHAVMPEAVKANSTYMTQQEIFDELFSMSRTSGCNWVTLSGGNPVMWDLEELVTLCRDAGIKVAVETQGTLWRDWLNMCDQVTISPKGPGMGETFEPDKLVDILDIRLRWEIDDPCRVPTCIKVVVFSQQDFEFACDIGSLLDRMEFPDGDRYLSLGNDEPPKLVGTKLDESAPALPDHLLGKYRTLLEDYLQDPRLMNWKFLPQLHVLVYSNKGGV